MITVTATQRVKDGKAAQLEALVQELTDEIRAKESGCLRFEHLRADDDPGGYVVIEQYADEAAFTHHKSTDYLQAFIPKLLALLEAPPQVTVYRDVASESALRRPPDSPFFHVGVVVRDLSEATERYARILGVTFTEPATFHVPQLARDPHPYQVVGVFSREGPPYLELIQASSDGIFSAASADQILYVGMWEGDMPARVEQLKKEGFGFEAILEDSDGVPFVCLTKPDGLEGMRIEFVGTGARAGIEQWVRTGVWEGTVAD
jgi:quinol monooxygenase YgiN